MSTSIPDPRGPAALRYDACLARCRDYLVPLDQPVPQPTSAWPAENVALLEKYREWLLSGGTSPKHTETLYIPMAGHALGLALRPHPELDLEADLAPAMTYIEAKGRNTKWRQMCRVSLEKFRGFLRQQRGEPERAPRPPDLSRYQQGLPAWLVAQLERYQRLRQRNWRPARLEQQILRFWGAHTRVWRWLLGHYAIADVADIRRQYLLDYVDHCLQAGHAASYVNSDLHLFVAFLLHLQDQGIAVPQALFRVPSLKLPEPLPKYLTDEQVKLLRDDFETRVAQAAGPGPKRDALLDRAAFFLLWQGGMRLGEVEDLKLEDLDLAKRRLTVRQGKGRKDRTVFLADSAVRAVQAYLECRGLGPTSHVFLYRNRSVGKDLIRQRIKAAGARQGFNAYPHRLRHTCATQLLNAGCPVTSIQKFLGHTRLNSTMRYARAYDTTVEANYFAAMERIERRLDLSGAEDGGDEPVAADERAQLLDLARELAQPELSAETRLALAERMQRLLLRHAPESENPGENGDQGANHLTMTVMTHNAPAGLPAPPS